MNEFLRAYAMILSLFLMDKETETRELRFLLKGFDLNLVNLISSNLEKVLKVKIPVVSLGEKYGQAIKSRASNEPIFIWVAGKTASEYSSLSSTFKCLMNVFHPFQRRWERVDGIYDLYDVTEWLFKQRKFELIASELLPKGEYSEKRKTIEASWLCLNTLWNFSLTHPSLRNRLSPGLIAGILANIYSAHEYVFNKLVEAIGFAPCLTIPNDEKAITRFYDNSTKIILLLKGSDADKRSKFSKLCENTIAGIILFWAGQSVESAKKPKDYAYILRLLREKDEKGRRVWIVLSSDVEIKEYSLSSGLVKRVVFRLRNRKTKETFVFDNSWNILDTAGNLSLFLKYIENTGVSGKAFACVAPFTLVVNKEEVELTFNYLEAYNFGRRNFRKELDELQIQ